MIKRDQLTKEQALALLRSGFGAELQRAAYQCTAPVFWADPSIEPPEFNNGSIFFLDCGEGPFAVTADHVYAGYLARKDRSPGLVCQVGRLMFRPEDRLIERDKGLDVATFRMTTAEIEKTTKWVHGPTVWPPDPPEQGRGVFFSGFARAAREEEVGAITFGATSFLLTATVVGPDAIKCQFDRDSFVDLGSGMPPEPLSLGGISGAPLWTLVDEPVVGWRLAGVITEFSDPFEILVARRANCIAPNGHLLR